MGECMEAIPFQIRMFELWGKEWIPENIAFIESWKLDY